MWCIGRHKHGEWYARLCVIFATSALGEEAGQYVLVKYYEEQQNDEGTRMPRVTWATRRRGNRIVNFYDIAHVRTVLRPVFLQPDYRQPSNLAYFVNNFVS